MTQDSIFVAKATKGVIPFFNTIGQEKKTARTGLFFCQKGSASVELDGKIYKVSPHTLTTYFAFSKLVIVEKSSDMQGIVIGGDLEIVQPLLYNISDFNSLFLIRQNPITELTEQQERNILMYIELISDILMRLCGGKESETEMQKRMKDMRQLQLEQLVTSMMFDVVSYYSNIGKFSKETSRKDDVLMRFITSLYKNYKEEHEVTFYSNQQYLTSRYFSAIIKSKSGKTPSQWIATALLVDAKKRLRQSTLSVKEISEELNFPNQSYFGKWFKNLTGISPLEFKNGKDETIVIEDEFTNILNCCSLIAPNPDM